MLPAPIAPIRLIAPSSVTNFVFFIISDLLFHFMIIFSFLCTFHSVTCGSCLIRNRLLRYCFITQWSHGGHISEISATVLKDIKVLQPNLEIVKKFEIKVSSINNYIRDNEVQNQELTQLRDWLLPMLMNGQVKVE